MNSPSETDSETSATAVTVSAGVAERPPNRPARPPRVNVRVTFSQLTIGVDSVLIGCDPEFIRVLLSSILFGRG